MIELPIDPALTRRLISSEIDYMLRRSSASCSHLDLATRVVPVRMFADHRNRQPMP